MISKSNFAPMSGPQQFTTRERERFRKLLEVANSTTYEGEKDAALAAATRMASSRGMNLHEAAGMKESAPSRRHARLDKSQHRRKDSRSEAKFRDSFRAPRGAYHNEKQNLKAEKDRYEKAMADAVRRGLRLDKEPSTTKRPAFLRRSGSGTWRSRPDFIRVLLRETQMSAQDIAATVGVSIHDVFREKLLMRQK